jgi:hypothetical protein
MERRTEAKENAKQQRMRRAQNRESVKQALDRVRNAARQRKVLTGDPPCAEAIGSGRDCTFAVVARSPPRPFFCWWSLPGLVLRPAVRGWGLDLGDEVDGIAVGVEPPGSQKRRPRHTQVQGRTVMIEDSPS